MIVVDTNVLVYLYIETEYTAPAEALFEQDPDWHVPLLWQSEFRNVLSGMMKQGLISLTVARHIYYAAAELVNSREYRVDPMEVLRLAHSSGCSAYDCEFLHLAEYLDTVLVTMDKKLLQAFPDRTRSLETFG